MQRDGPVGFPFGAGCGVGGTHQFWQGLCKVSPGCSSCSGSAPSQFPSSGVPAGGGAAFAPSPTLPSTSCALPVSLAHPCSCAPATPLTPCTPSCHPIAPSSPSPPPYYALNPIPITLLCPVPHPKNPPAPYTHPHTLLHPVPPPCHPVHPAPIPTIQGHPAPSPLFHLIPAPRGQRQRSGGTQAPSCSRRPGGQAQVGWQRGPSRQAVSSRRSEQERGQGLPQDRATRSPPHPAGSGHVPGGRGWGTHGPTAQGSRKGVEGVLGRGPCPLVPCGLTLAAGGTPWAGPALSRLAGTGPATGACRGSGAGAGAQSQPPAAPTR